MLGVGTILENTYSQFMQTDSQQVHVIYLGTLTKHFHEVEPQLKCVVSPI